MAGTKARVSIVLSGGGTTAEAVIRACKSRAIPAEVALVIATKTQAGGIDRAFNAGVPVSVLPRRAFLNRERWGDAILRKCDKYGADILALYGCLERMPANVVARFEGRSINQHPGHPKYFGGPGMYGIRVHCTTLEFLRQPVVLARRIGDLYTVACAQRVAPEVDDGGILVSRRVPVFGCDTARRLAERVLPVEHAVQIEALSNLIRGADPVLEGEPFVFPDELSYVEKAKQFALLAFPSRKAS